MGEKYDPMLVEEQELFEQEKGLVEMEAELFAQEKGLSQAERAFTKRHQTLLNLVGYVADQERLLLERAVSLGGRAKRMVSEGVGASGGETLADTGEIGLIDERQAMIERRRELLAVRMELADEREGLYASRHEAMEQVEGQMQGVEQRLLSREKEISEVLRKLIVSASELSEDGDDDDDPAPAPDTTDNATVDAPSAGDPARVRTRHPTSSKSQFRITLEADVGGEEPHHFFRYEADGTDTLPGLFVATPNLLKAGREVRLVIRLDGQDPCETRGVVAWRCRPSEDGGETGMGIDILSFEADGKDAVDTWLTDHPPVTA
jgi:hypothetical protein